MISTTGAEVSVSVLATMTRALAAFGAFASWPPVPALSGQAFFAIVVLFLCVRNVAVVRYLI